VLLNKKPAEAGCSSKPPAAHPPARSNFLEGGGHEHGRDCLVLVSEGFNFSGGSGGAGCCSSGGLAVVAALGLEARLPHRSEQAAVVRILGREAASLLLGALGGREALARR
jgi:hypothetical protein